MSGYGLGATITMSGIKENKNGEAFNNPFEMVPTTGKMIKQMSSTFLSVTTNEGKKPYSAAVASTHNPNFRRWWRRTASSPGRY